MGKDQDAFVNKMKAAGFKPTSLRNEIFEALDFACEIESMKILCYSVRLKSLVPISDKAFLAEGWNGLRGFIEI